MNIETQIATILLSAGEKESPLRPTELYNEGWMLRLILDWCSREAPESHPLYFLPGAKWASERLIPTHFPARSRTDLSAEKWTHADGIIGHILFGVVGKGDVQLDRNAKQLVVVEAKMFSPLSSGTKNAPDFDQAARNVACIVELLSQKGILPEKISPLAFYVTAPQWQIDLFANQLSKTSIQAKVEKRIKDYGSERDLWFEEWFLPTLSKMKIEALSWEVLSELAGPEYQEFYRRCVQFNQPHFKQFIQIYK